MQKNLIDSENGLTNFRHSLIIYFFVKNLFSRNTYDVFFGLAIFGKHVFRNLEIIHQSNPENVHLICYVTKLWTQLSQDHDFEFS